MCRATELYTGAYRILCTEKDTSSVTEAKHASLYGDKFDEISAQMLSGHPHPHPSAEQLM